MRFQILPGSASLLKGRPPLVPLDVSEHPVADADVGACAALLDVRPEREIEVLRAVVGAAVWGVDRGWGMAIPEQRSALLHHLVRAVHRPIQPSLDLNPLIVCLVTCARTSISSGIPGPTFVIHSGLPERAYGENRSLGQRLGLHLHRVPSSLVLERDGADGA